MDGATVAIGRPYTGRGWSRACPAGLAVATVSFPGDIRGPGCRAGAGRACCNTSPPLGQAARQRACWPDDRKERALVLLCLDAAVAARDLAAGTLACPSCGAGRLARWGHGAERVIRLAGGRRSRLRPDRARCRSCRRTHILLPSWCAPRRADGIEVIGAAAGAAMAGQGHRPIAAALGLPPGTVRGWLRRLRARAGPLRSHAIGELARLGFYPPGPPCTPAGSPLADALNAVAAAVDCAIRRFGFGPELTWPLIGRLGLARFLTPVPAG